jgi:hypothetical protein
VLDEGNRFDHREIVPLLHFDSRTAVARELAVLA